MGDEPQRYNREKKTGNAPIHCATRKNRKPGVSAGYPIGRAGFTDGAGMMGRWFYTGQQFLGSGLPVRQFRRPGHGLGRLVDPLGALVHHFDTVKRFRLHLRSPLAA